LVKIRPKRWQRYGLESWIEAAKKRLHHNVLAIALANKARSHRLGRPQWRSQLRDQIDETRSPSRVNQDEVLTTMRNAM
jgi:hypothetical protein